MYDDTTDDRCTERDWQQAAQRAFTTLGEQHRAADGPGRLLLVACLCQGLRLAHDHRLDIAGDRDDSLLSVRGPEWMADPCRGHQLGVSAESSVASRW
ncbi:hypothetical protein [Streptomyces sp. NPDC050263]|uniref:hypothetical protein n=1 Tax=Streptomyces sp. NPDC050263 TaxID=3155037 RepID=UPI00343BBD35